MALSVLGKFCNFYFVKNDKIENNSTTTESEEKIIPDWEPLKLYDLCELGFVKFKTLLNKITNCFLREPLLKRYSTIECLVLTSFD